MIVLTYKEEKHVEKPYKDCSYDRAGNKLDVYFGDVIAKDSDVFKELNSSGQDRIKGALSSGIVGSHGEKGIKFLTDAQGKRMKIGPNYMIELKFMGNQQLGGNLALGDYRLIGLYNPTIRSVYS